MTVQQVAQAVMVIWARTDVPLSTRASLCEALFENLASHVTYWEGEPISVARNGLRDLESGDICDGTIADVTRALRDLCEG